MSRLVKETLNEKFGPAIYTRDKIDEKYWGELVAYNGVSGTDELKSVTCFEDGFNILLQRERNQKHVQVCERKELTNKPKHKIKQLPMDLEHDEQVDEDEKAENEKEENEKAENEQESEEEERDDEEDEDEGDYSENEGDEDQEEDEGDDDELLQSDIFIRDEEPEQDEEETIDDTNEAL